MGVREGMGRVGKARREGFQTSRWRRVDWGRFRGRDLEKLIGIAIIGN